MGLDGGKSQVPMKSYATEDYVISTQSTKATDVQDTDLDEVGCKVLIHLDTPSEGMCTSYGLVPGRSLKTEWTSDPVGPLVGAAMCRHFGEIAKAEVVTDGAPLVVGSFAPTVKELLRGKLRDSYVSYRKPSRGVKSNSGGPELEPLFEVGKRVREDKLEQKEDENFFDEDEEIDNQRPPRKKEQTTSKKKNHVIEKQTGKRNRISLGETENIEEESPGMRRRSTRLQHRNRLKRRTLCLLVPILIMTLTETLVNTNLVIARGRVIFGEDAEVVFSKSSWIFACPYEIDQANGYISNLKNWANQQMDVVRMIAQNSSTVEIAEDGLWRTVTDCGKKSAVSVGRGSSNLCGDRCGNHPIRKANKSTRQSRMVIGLKSGYDDVRSGEKSLESAATNMSNVQDVGR